MTVPASAWIIFNLVVFTLLVLDLLILHRRPHAVSLKESLCWTAFWMSLSFSFAGGIWATMGKEAALTFTVAYIIEQSLSADNLFVFMLIFSYFKVPPLYQRKVLFWGILGAVAMRAVFILAGVALLNRFQWIMYIFGAILIWSGIKMLKKIDDQIDLEKNVALRLYRKFFKVSESYEGGSLFVRRDGGWIATPLFIVLLVVETTDLIFAVDSIPAVLAITTDPFIAYTSNVCAVLGLRSLYFALAALSKLFHYLHYGLSIILVFIGLKMVLKDYIHLNPGVTLSITLGLLTVSILASIVRRERGLS